MRISKRPVVLLEVIIALALVALCALPLLAPQTDIIRAERRFLHQIEADRVAGVIYADIVQKMYGGSITWEELLSSEERDVEGVLFPPGWPFKTTYHFETIKMKPDKTNPKYALFRILITMRADNMKTLEFPYTIFVEKEQQAEEKAETVEDNDE